MGENLPIKRNEGIFFKIKDFFRNLFQKEITSEKNISNEDTNEYDIEKFINSIKVNIETELDEAIKNQQRDEMIVKFKQNPESLKTISINTLERLVNYYENCVDKKRKKVLK